MITLLLLSLLAAKPDLATVFPREADVQTNAAGLVRLPLPSEVLRACHGDLADVRVFDGAGKEIPYLIDSGDQLLEKKETVRLEIKKVQRHETPHQGAPSLYEETFDVSAPPDGEWALVFDTKALEIVRSAKITAIDKDGVARELAAAASLFRLPHMQAERLRVPISITRASRLVVSIAGEGKGYMEPSLSVERRTIVGGNDLLTLPLERLSEAQQASEHGTRTAVTFARPAGVLPRAIALSTATDLFDRRVRVVDVGRGVTETTLGAARLFRIHGFVDVSETELRLSDAWGDRLRIEIENEASPPLEALTASAIVRQPVLVFFVPASKATLRFGGGRVTRPRYDVGRLLSDISESLGKRSSEGATQLFIGKLAALGPLRDNPRFNQKPALAFAMRPGAPIDVSTFTHRAILPLVPSADGLASFTLPVELAAVARPDFGDVRVVDKKAQQWPYLRDRELQPETRPLLVSSEAEDKASRLTLKDAFAPMLVDQIELDADAPYFERAATLYAVGKEKRVIASTRLTRKNGDDAAIVLAFSPERAAAFELVVQNGDDAPLVFTAARARHVRPQLFVTAPAGDYVLLAGNADATSPSYELAAIEDTVLAVSATAALPNVVEKNPDYRLVANLTTQDRALHAGLWLIIALAVIVLGALTLRLAKP
ncbi:MAG: DUF3999 family protein [Deltaproteobacteria bacterium]|nr:DUF3999 family protein [Deltaproteobacteria bacterium]